MGSAQEGDWMEAATRIDRPGTRLAYANCCIRANGRKIARAEYSQSPHLLHDLKSLTESHACRQNTTRHGWDDVRWTPHSISVLRGPEAESPRN